MDNQSKDAWEGWSIVGAVTVALTLVVTMEAMLASTPSEGVRGIIRATARCSFVLFALAATASAVYHFWPNPWTRWQLRNRRYLGVSFATAHFVHLLAIFALAQIAPDELAARTNAITWIFGGLAYVFIGLMALTSFDRSARAIGPRTWSLLHTTGTYYIWLIFANSYLARAVAMPTYIPAGLLVVFILGARFAAHLSKAKMRQGTSRAGAG